jgi:hypothetical protein
MLLHRAKQSGGRVHVIVTIQCDQHRRQCGFGQAHAGRKHLLDQLPTSGTHVTMHIRCTHKQKKEKIIIKKLESMSTQTHAQTPPKSGASRIKLKNPRMIVRVDIPRCNQRQQDGF